MIIERGIFMEKGPMQTLVDDLISSAKLPRKAKKSKLSKREKRFLRSSVWSPVSPDMLYLGFALLPKKFKKQILRQVYKKRLIKLRRKVKKNKSSKKFKKR